MRRFFAFLILASVKTVARLFFEEKFTWEPSRDRIRFEDARLVILLNHTSLFEPLFLSGFTYSFLWKMAGKLNVPIASVTLDRPIVGLLFKLMLPKVASITRKKDETWETYLQSIEKNDLVMIAPEGRMKRTTGLDKHGKKMHVQGGVADIIDRMEEGNVLICLSGGLHHIQAPGELLPKFFRQIRMHVVQIPIREFKARFSVNPRERKIQIVQDLQHRLETQCPPIGS